MLPIDFGSIDAIIKPKNAMQESPAQESTAADHLAVLVHGVR